MRKAIGPLQLEIESPVPSRKQAQLKKDTAKSQGPFLDDVVAARRLLELAGQPSTDGSVPGIGPPSRASVCLSTPHLEEVLLEQQRTSSLHNSLPIEAPLREEQPSEVTQSDDERSEVSLQEEAIAEFEELSDPAGAFIDPVPQRQSQIDNHVPEQKQRYDSDALEASQKAGSSLANKDDNASSSRADHPASSSSTHRA